MNTNLCAEYPTLEKFNLIGFEKFIKKESAVVYSPQEIDELAVELCIQKDDIGKLEHFRVRTGEDAAKMVAEYCPKYVCTNKVAVWTVLKNNPSILAAVNSLIHTDKGLPTDQVQELRSCIDSINHGGNMHPELWGLNDYYASVKNVDAKIITPVDIGSKAQLPILVSDKIAQKKVEGHGVRPSLLDKSPKVNSTQTKIPKKQPSVSSKAKLEGVAKGALLPQNVKSKNIQTPSSIKFTPEVPAGDLLRRIEVGGDSSASIKKIFDEYVKSHVSSARRAPDFEEQRRWSIACLIQQNSNRHFDSDIDAGKFLDNELLKSAQYSALKNLLKEEGVIAMCNFFIEQINSQAMSSDFVADFLESCAGSKPSGFEPLGQMKAAKATVVGFSKLLEHLKNPFKLLVKIKSQRELVGDALSHYEYLLDCIGPKLRKEELHQLVWGGMGTALVSGRYRDIEVWANIYRKAGFSSEQLAKLMTPHGGLRDRIEKGCEQTLRAYGNALISIQGDKASKLDQKHADQLWRAIKKEHMGTFFNITEYKNMSNATLKHFQAAKKLLQAKNYP